MMIEKQMGVVLMKLVETVLFVNPLLKQDKLILFI